ncbi:zip homologous protein 2-like isoform X1 [Crassostrea angulata]|uniref:zip homologous protein 2-like isoform X1 n=1 Tax=Magallana angulata TaxID=2784310 RepID=UPI0022B0986F|nr:zip homologous protein 2-like isoform X1 [Crassostrea angulata]XP_052718332.1 zip homologous protein 2-like isoform X1 [Crassostrea angulata]
MGDWIHCNNCFLRPGTAPVQFRLTTCGHIYCDACVENATKTKCQMCGSTNVNVIPLSAKMGPDVQIFFTNIVELVKKNTQQIIQVLEFQNSHRRRYLSYLAAQLNKLKECMEKAQKLYKYNQELEKELTNSKEEIAYLKRAIKEQNIQQHSLIEISSNKNSPQTASRSSTTIIGPNYVNPKYGMRTTPPYLDRQNRNTPPFGSKSFLGKTPPSSQELKRISPRGSPGVQDCFGSYMQVGVRQGRGASRISPSVDSRETLRNSPSQSQSSTEIQRSSGHARAGVQIRHSPMEHSDNLGMLRNQINCPLHKVHTDRCPIPSHFEHVDEESERCSCDCFSLYH